MSEDTPVYQVDPTPERAPEATSAASAPAGPQASPAGDHLADTDARRAQPLAALRTVSEQANAAEQELARRLRSMSTELPEDPDSEKFGQALQSMRPHFQDRTSFVHFVCEQLIERGVPPNSSNIQKLAKWGSSSDMSADVRAWWPVFAQRLRGANPRIPAAARPRFNELAEQIYGLALSLAQTPLAAFKADMEERVKESLARQEELSDTLATLRSDHSRLRMQADSWSKEAAQLSGALKAAVGELEQQARSHAEVTAKMRQDHERAVDQLNKRHTEAMHLRERELSDERQARQSLTREAAANLQTTKDAHAQVVQSLQASITRLEDLVDSTRRDAAVQVDAARQDAREAHKRASATELRLEEARTVERALREQITRAEVAHQQAQAQLQSAAKTIEALQAELVQAREKAAQAAQADATPAAGKRK